MVLEEGGPAVVLCEGYFGQGTGKTAHGLVRHSRRFRIVGVIDSTRAGEDAGTVLDGRPRGVPIFASLQEALDKADPRPAYLIVGVATFGGFLPDGFRPILEEALDAGLHVVAGLHEYLAEDEDLRARAAARGVRLIDVRRPRPLRELKQFADRARHLPCLRLPVLGTDGAVGKRTTAVLLTEALNAADVPTAFVATGQTGLLQGARYGVPLDGIRGDFMVGELEGEIVRAFEEERPKVIVIEGQGSISHPAYVCGSRAVLMASQPTGVVLQHAPGRPVRNFRRDVLTIPMPTLEREIRLIEAFSDAKVIALTVNHEGLERAAVEETVAAWEATYGIPACDPLWHGVGKVVAAVRERL